MFRVLQGASWRALGVLAWLLASASCGEDSASGSAKPECESAPDGEGGEDGCGDGVVQGDEECDDGNRSNTDRCVENCRQAACGDGFVRANVEECDAGPEGDERCSEECLTRAPADPGECGDGVVQWDEQCDFGAMPEDATGRECEVDPTIFNGPGVCACNPLCRFKEQCGNGIVDSEEECDDGSLYLCDQLVFNHDNASCTTLCHWNYCGDGHAYVIETNPDSPYGLEQCDDANRNNNDACVIEDIEADDEPECRWNTCGDNQLYTQAYSNAYDQHADGVDADVLRGACPGVPSNPCDPISALLDDDFACDNPFPLEECDDGDGEACADDCALP